MRGALDQAGFGDGFDRIIPAYAGSTSVSPCRRGAPKDHPRVCGEHGLNATSGPPLEGSSPRMRGAPCRRRRLGRDGRRIIPAYAGSTDGYFWKTDQRKDHPRVCGEHKDRGYRDVFVGGSLRVCGEHCRPWLRRLARSGSSPRMRGAPLHFFNSFCIRRIIPAYAGSTFWPGWSTMGIMDHPRVCGEHLDESLGLEQIGGSSPRMRGARICIVMMWWWCRIIPAYAGST